MGLPEDWFQFLKECVADFIILEDPFYEGEHLVPKRLIPVENKGAIDESREYLQN